MKRVIAALLLLCLAFGLCACQTEPEEVIPTRPNATPITEPTEDPNAVVIPEGEGTSEQEALYTFFYVRKALTNAITA